MRISKRIMFLAYVFSLKKLFYEIEIKSALFRNEWKSQALRFVHDQLN